MKQCPIHKISVLNLGVRHVDSKHVATALDHCCAFLSSTGKCCKPGMTICIPRSRVLNVHDIICHLISYA